jgi:hypothetical protein
MSSSRPTLSKELSRTLVSVLNHKGMASLDVEAPRALLIGRRRANHAGTSGRDTDPPQLLPHHASHVLGSAVEGSKLRRSCPRQEHAPSSCF